VIADALDNALSGVADGSLQPSAALQSVQVATDKALAH
jgi:raffinose/stachyose/melibiose transport system substrate-binding protein